MNSLFKECTSLKSLDISHFDTSKVTNMEMMFGWCSSLKTIYCGNLWNMNNVSKSNYMFGGCSSLVGGKGTVFDSDHTDGEYARIDGGSARPGYFTASSSSSAGSPIHYVALPNGH